MPEDKSHYYCVHPWTHVSIEPGGEVYPCCYSLAPFRPLSFLQKNGTTTDIFDIFNTKDYKQLRKSTMEGLPIPRCVACNKQEKRGGVSERQIFNHKLSLHIKELTHDPSTELWPLHLSLRFSNICNYACRICSGEYSTSWYKEEKELQSRTLQSPKKIFNSLDAMKKTLRPALPHLKYLYFAGGEPLISEEHLCLLEMCIEENHVKKTLSYNTNLSTLEFKNRSYIELWKEFEHIEIGASLDGSGLRGEYLRYGQDWEKTCKNIKRIRDQNEKFSFSINSVISIHNALHFPDFIEEMIDLYGLTPHSFSISPLKTPSFMSLQVLPNAYKKTVQKKYKNLQKKLLLKWGEKDSIGLRIQLSSTLSYMLESDRSHLLPLFLEHTQRIDNLRNQSLASTFPELSDL